MLKLECKPTRRNFLKGGVGMAVGLSTLAVLPVSTNAAENAWIVGPQPGFTPEIGTLTSMLAFTREQVVNNVKGLHNRILTFCWMPMRTPSAHCSYISWPPKLTIR
jgi:hypothetical protein